MRKISLFLLMCVNVVVLWAQGAPDILIRTNIYQTQGPTNAFTLVLGAAPGCDGYADVLCSGGNQSEAEIITAYFDAELSALIGTNIACQVDAEGIVEVYCDPGVVIDYISCTGAEITSIEIKNPEVVELLALEHNALESLDLTAFCNLQALYLRDNPFNVSPLVVGPNKPKLTILDLSIIENLDPDFDIKDYSQLLSFDAMNTPSLRHITPSGCPRLQKLSIDNTNVETLDLSNNVELYILNISETRIADIDISPCKKLQQFYATHSSAFNSDVKLKKLDVTHNPDLIYLFATDNALTELDVTKCPYLQDLYVSKNYLTSLNLDNNENLINVYYAYNCMDFNTLPIPKEYWGSYESKQRPLSVPSANLAGQPIDLASKVIRQDSETFVAVFSSNENRPGIYNEVPQEAYSFVEGKLTFNYALTDSVYASFYNGTFPDIELVTTSFMVKDESTFGQDDLAVKIGTSATAGSAIKMFIGIAGATEQSPKTFYVDLGDGVKQEFIATTSTMPEVANVDVAKPAFGSMKVYTKEGDKLIAFKMEDIKLNSLDLSACHQLAYLTLRNTKLTSLDLQWNRALEALDISGNNFGESFTLSGANGAYSKNMLTHIRLSDNNMTEVKLNEPGSWRRIDLSHNCLTSVNFTDADYLQYLDISYNNLDYLKVNYCGEMDTLYCNNNAISSMVLPESNNIKYLDCSNNCFTLTTMPERNGLDEEHYIYAPQAVIDIPTKGPGYNLNSQYVVIDGYATEFEWMEEDGTPLTVGVDYTCDKGITHFEDSTIGKQLFCQLHHEAFPAFTGENSLRTTCILSAGMPTHLLGSFTTVDSDKQATLSVASAVANNAIYIDWTGTRSLEQYPMGTTYTVYNATTTAGVKVNVWSYDDNDNLTVFSLSGIRLSDVDLSGMEHLTTLTLNDAGISSLVMPRSNRLSELSLDNNRFSSINMADYPTVQFMSVTGNDLTELDLSGASRLQLFSAGNNKIRTVRFGDNDALWSLALSANQISEINFEGAPNLYQVFLNYNNLSTIDLENLSQLRVIYLDHNKFDFSTLPLPRDYWTVYIYGHQAELKIQDGSVVDLGYLSQRDGIPTIYTWFYGYPEIDDLTGEISGEELFIDEEYTIENGVTTFHADLDRACCVLTNPVFPQAYMITNLISTTTASLHPVLGDAEADEMMKITVNDRDISVTGLTEGAVIRLITPSGICTDQSTITNGRAVFSNTTPGIYLVASPKAFSKVAVK